MAFIGQTFNVADIPEDKKEFAPIPAGWYRGQITKSELKDTKSGGKMISIGLTITGPEYQGRVIFANLNIRNPSAEAERIGQQQLGAVLRAIGLARVQDTDELIGGNLEFKVAIRKSEEYGDQNDVKGFRAIQGSSVPTPAANPFKSKISLAESGDGSELDAGTSNFPKF